MATHGPWHPQVCYDPEKGGWLSCASNTSGSRAGGPYACDWYGTPYVSRFRFLAVFRAKRWAARLNREWRARVRQNTRNRLNIENIFWRDV